LARPAIEDISWVYPGDVDASAALAWLSEAERTYFYSVHNVTVQAEYLLTRYVERTTLARTLGCDPSALRFARTARNQPYLVSHPGWFYSLSNTRGLVVCAVSEAPIGIDVEHASRAKTLRGLDNTVLTPAERRTFREQDDAQEALTRVVLWCAKEAASKCLGLGLDLDFTEVHCTLSEHTPSGGAVQIASRGLMGAWQLREGYVVALLQEGTHKYLR
jgi:4'-phosphopantetheinyl transferase